MSFIIVDIDGCVSNDSHRRHFSDQRDFDDYHRMLHLDAPNFYIVRLLSLNLASNIVLLTGREEKYRPQTLKWLNEYVIPFQELIMRPMDNRHLRSSEFKEAAFLAYIKRNNLQPSDCALAIEDLPAVVKVWKSYGIPVLQVHQKGSL